MKYNPLKYHLAKLDSPPKYFWIICGINY